MNNYMFRFIFCAVAGICISFAGCTLSFKGEKIDVGIEKEAPVPVENNL